MFFQAVQAVFTIFVLVMVGYVISKKQWLNQSNKDQISNIVVHVATPCAVFSSMVASFNKEMLFKAGKLILIPAIQCVLMYLLARFFAKYILKMPRSRHGVFATMCSCANTIFMGLPIVLGIFGNEGVPVDMYYLICTTVFFWSIGVMSMEADGGNLPKLNLKELLPRLISRNLVLIIIVVILVQLGITLPNIITVPVRYIGNVATPLGLFFTGYALYNLIKLKGIKGLKITRDIVAVMVARFIVSPAIAFVLCPILGITGVERGAIIVMSAISPMAQTVIVSDKYGSDKDFAAVTVSVTTLMCMAVVPLLMLLI